MEPAINLSGRIKPFLGDIFIGRITEGKGEIELGNNKQIFLKKNKSCRPMSAKYTATFDAFDGEGIKLPSTLKHLTEGDIVRINPPLGEVRVLYRIQSPHNSLFFTERCNSRCTMCSQPPQLADDSYLINEILQTIPLMDKKTEEIGITGGEPTLNIDGLEKVLKSLSTNLPDTAVHVLSNGRLLSYLKNAIKIAEAKIKNIMFGIPLYSDIASKHEYVVQAKGAFDQTVLGIMNLARVGVPVEIRFVIHAETVNRLPETAKYIARNMPFVSHVALMGLEIMGYAIKNLEQLWIDPFDYQNKLDEAVDVLSGAGLNVSIYNHQLCTIPKSVWPFARKSISDWKNAYHSECETCSVKTSCAGFFSSAVTKRSSHISPISKESVLSEPEIACLVDLN